MRLSRRGLERCNDIEASQVPNYLKDLALYEEKIEDGIIVLSIAENSLLSAEILDELSKARMTEAHLRYRPSLLQTRTETLEKALRRYTQDALKPKFQINTINSVLGPGIGALLAQLVWCLTDPGDGVLLSTPFYTDYARDIKHPAQARVILAHTSGVVDPLSPAVLPYLREAIQDPANRIRALVLCNPHNPLGRCYEPETIRGCADLAKEFDMHLIVDEVFANSVYTVDDSLQPFRSVLSLEDLDWQRIHVLHAPTKDLGCSGLKAGILLSQNLAILRMVALAMYPTAISAATDAGLTHLLSHPALPGMLDRNKQLLAEARGILIKWCDSHKLEYETTNAGVFCLVDFEPLIARLPDYATRSVKENTAAAVERMIAHRVFIKPHSKASGDHLLYRFRLVFSHPVPVLENALRRLEAAFDLV